MREVLPEIRELIEQGKILYSVGNYNDAEEYLKKAIELDPYCEEAYENLGVCYVMMDRFGEARKLFNKYLLLDKKSGLIYFHLGNIALLENLPDEAKAMYSKAELLGYQNPIMAINLAAYYEEQEEYDKSIEQYTKLLRINPYEYDIMERKTQLLIRIGRFEEGLSLARKMVQTDIDRFEGHHYVYIGLIMQKKYNDAKEYISEVIKRFPENETVLFDKVRLYDLMGNTEEALQAIEEYFPESEKIPHVATLKFGMLLQLQKTEEALLLVEKSEDLQKNENILTMMYSLYFSKGDFESAYKYCQMIRDLGEESSQYYASFYFMALAKDKMGETEVAREFFEKAIAIYKKVCLTDARHVDLYMYRALCEYQIGNISEAKKCIEYLLAIKSDYAVFHQVAGIIYDAAGELSEAEKHKRLAKEIDPDTELPLV